VVAGLTSVALVFGVTGSVVGAWTEACSGAGVAR